MEEMLGEKSTAGAATVTFAVLRGDSYFTDDA